LKYFPVFLTGSSLSSIVVGGGEVAARKIELLLKSSSKITVMSQHISPSVARLIEKHQLNHLAHNYTSGLLKGVTVVIAATDDPDINALVAQEATGMNILVNVVDAPDLCTYITPAIIDRSPMLIALSSSGSAPILLRMLRESIEKTLPSQYGKLADFSFRFRDTVKSTIRGLSNRRVFWETVLRGNVGESILKGQYKKAETDFMAILDKGIAPSRGKLSFFHTLCGEPDDLTLRAHRCLQFADAVYYHSSLNENFIEYVRRDAEKFPFNETDSSLTIQSALAKAKQGQKVIFFLADTQDLSPYLSHNDNTEIEQYFSGVQR